MRRLPVLLVLLLVACSAPSGGSVEPMHPKTSFTKTADIVFTPATWPVALKADLYLPKGPGPWPAVVLVYGGSWSTSDHRWHMIKIARKLAGRGYAVLNTSYRGAPDFVFPAAYEDLQQAVHWLRTHAAEHHLDERRVAAYGFSAGGQLAALLGTRDAPADLRIQAVVDASGPVDMEYAASSPAVQKFLGGAIGEKPEAYRAASALAHVSADDPPVFIYQGTDDKTVDPEHSRRFAAALERAGVRHELHWLEGRSHAGALIRGGAAEDRAIDFLDRVLRPESP